MASQTVHFFAEDVKFKLKGKKVLKEWIRNAIFEEGKLSGAINFIFCSDTYLHNINLQYLNHDYFTDIITFDNSEEKDVLSGDIYISIERVRENAKMFQCPLNQEIRRVIVHGILHLIGYQDKSSSEIKLMRSKEDYYLSLLPDLSR